MSYTAASVYPSKIFFDLELLENIIKNKKILPRHIQLNITNKCNLNCSFCSCSERDKSIELPFEKVIEIMQKFKELGCVSATLTGGGEPLMHPNVNEIILAIKDMGIEMGLVSNGILLDKLSNEALNSLIWLRVSFADYRKFKEIKDPLSKAIQKSKKVDWAFSYVVGEKPNLLNIQEILKFANLHNFTHIRLVNDIFIAEKLKDQMNYIKVALRKLGLDDKKVIYQDRGTWTKGVKKCWISLLKPVIAANGKLYPCCGSQYMFKNPKRDYEGEMGSEKKFKNSIKEIEEIWFNQKCFDGSLCDKCYYNHYNELLDILLSEIKHQRFV